MYDFYSHISSLYYLAISTIFDHDNETQVASVALGPSGDYALYWRTMAMFSGGLLSMAVAMLQIGRISDSELAMPFLLSALEYAFYGLMANYTIYAICCGVQNDEDVEALRQAADNVGRKMICFAVMFPLFVVLWAAIFIVTTFVVSYTCPSTICDTIGNAFAQISWLGTPVIIALTVTCQMTHAIGIGWIYTQYRTALFERSNSAV